MQILRATLTQLKRAAYRKLAVRENVVAGPSVHFGPGSIVSAPTKLVIEDDVYIGKYCTIQCDGRIGRWALIANNVGIIGRNDHDHRTVGIPIRWAPHVEDVEHLAGPGDVVEIEEDVWIGYGAIILTGVMVGRGSIVAAGAVVNANIPRYSIVAGNPAKVVGSRFARQRDIEAHEGALYR